MGVRVAGLIGLSALLLSACSSTPPAAGALDVYTRTIRSGAPEPGGVATLFPPFREGMRKGDVESVLKRSGYVRTGTGVVSPVAGEPSLSVWEKTLSTATANGSPCIARYSITVHFDGDDTLMHAEGRENGCAS